MREFRRHQALRGLSNFEQETCVWKFMFYSIYELNIKALYTTICLTGFMFFILTIGR